MLCRIPLMLFASVAISSLSPAHAADLDIVGPQGSVRFGSEVVVLPNGNIVVTDPRGPVATIGAVYLYSPNGALISTLTGGSDGDQVGDSGIQVLPNGNFLVRSSKWRNPATAAANAGAVTWVNGTTGLSGAVSEFNSLVGTSADDSVGFYDVAILTTGNYVVSTVKWDNGPVTNAGAVIWGNGNGGINGPVRTSNAFVGTQSSDEVGRSVVPLSNGNYVIGSPKWNSGAVADIGAVTWANGSAGIVGAVSSSNSLIGASAGDLVSSGGITALSNGNYVVSSASWRNGAITKAGAVTWADGSTGFAGVVSSVNSLVGSSTGDEVGGGGAIALINGNYVVTSPKWANGTKLKAGAATWGSGSDGVNGPVSASNSLVGASANDGDFTGAGSLYKPVALSNGNYVVINPVWNNGVIADVGAVTWADGSSGRTGVISGANSLIGSSAGDEVGSGETIALANGHYVVGSRKWHRGGLANVGAATWCNGASGRVGVVSASNSLVGSRLGDGVGSDLYALENGNYVVASLFWDNATIADVGAVTWGNGSSGRSGAISPGNSLIGSTSGDKYGRVLALGNGDFIAGGGSWDNGNVVDAGAFTRVNGSSGFIGVPTKVNSIRGSKFTDGVGAGPYTKLGNNHYAVISRFWDRDSIANAGAVTILHNTAPTVGLLSTANSVLGTAADGGVRLNVTYDPVLDRAVVGRPADNTVTLRAFSLFANGFE